MTYASEIEEQLTDEVIEAVVIGEMGWSNFKEENKVIPAEKKGVVLTWEEGRALLDYEYNTGFGAPDCHAVVVYTPTRIISTYQYDGSTGFFVVMRNPTNGVKPEMPGG